MVVMQVLRAKVVNGRLLVDEPTTLPDGTEVDLTVADDGDDLDDDERTALHAALDVAWASARVGRTNDAQDMIRKLRSNG